MKHKKSLFAALSALCFTLCLAAIFYLPVTSMPAFENGKMIAANHPLIADMLLLIALANLILAVIFWILFRKKDK